MPKNKLLNGFIYNWPAKILSFVTAIMLFLIIQMVDTSERSFYIPVEVMLPAGYQVENTVPGQVEITVRGPEDELYRIIPEQVTGIFDFTDAASTGVHSRAIILNTENVVGISNMVTFTPDPGQVKLYLSPVEGEESE